MEEATLSPAKKASPPYRALSYVWGSKTGTRPLLCGDGTILITPNCEAALRSLRHKRRPVTLWVDAICINQRDLDEQAKQVAIMGDIYHKASEVLIWLGEGNDKVSKFFSRMWISSRIFQSESLSVVGTLHRDEPIVKSLFHTGAVDLSFQDLKEIFDNKWVTRIWTIQEQIIASKSVLVYGQARAPWKQFHKLNAHLELLLVKAGETSEGYHASVASIIRWKSRNGLLAYMRKLEAVLKERSDLSQWWKIKFLVELTRLSQLNNCSEEKPGDKIYGFYGLLLGKFERLPEVNYSRSIEDVCADFTMATIKSTNKFWPANTNFWRHEPDSLFSSWTPNMTLPPRPRSVGGTWVQGPDPRLGYSIRATRESKVENHIINGPRAGSISLKGLVFAKIHTQCKRWLLNTDDVFLANALASARYLFHWLVFCFCLGQVTATAGDPFDALACLLVTNKEGMDKDTMTRQLNQFRAILAWFREFMALHLQDNSLPMAPNFLSELEDVFSREFYNMDGFIDFAAVLDDLLDSVLFSTSTGHIGTTIGYIKQSDSVVLLAGSDLPVVVRQQEGGYWRCLGSAYVPGIMEGEAWPEESVNELETFVLV